MDHHDDVEEQTRLLLPEDNHQHHQPHYHDLHQQQDHHSAASAVVAAAAEPPSAQTTSSPQSSPTLSSAAISAPFLPTSNHQPHPSSSSAVIAATSSPASSSETDSSSSPLLSPASPLVPSPPASIFPTISLSASHPNLYKKPKRGASVSSATSEPPPYSPTSSKNGHAPSRTRRMACTLMWMVVTVIIIQGAFVATRVWRGADHAGNGGMGVGDSDSTPAESQLFPSPLGGISKNDGSSIKPFFINSTLNPFYPPNHSSKKQEPSFYTIPRQVHITLPNKQKIDHATQANLQAWTSVNKDFKVILYDDADMRSLVESVSKPAADGTPALFPGALKVYDGFTKNVERADFWRYLVVYMKGGVYADSDVLPVKSVDEWWDRVLTKGGLAEAVGNGTGIAAFKGDDPLDPSYPPRPHDSKKPVEVPLIQGMVGMEGHVSSELARMQMYLARRVQFCQWTFAFRPRHPFLRRVILLVMENVRRENEIKDGSSPRTWGEWLTSWEGWKMSLMMRTGPGVFSRGVEGWIADFGSKGQEEGDEEKGWWGWWLGAEGRGKEKEVGSADTPAMPERRRYPPRALFSTTDFPDVTLHSSHVATTDDLIHLYRVVNSVAFLPHQAFADTPTFADSRYPYNSSEVLVRHLFRGSWKVQDVEKGWREGKGEKLDFE
ncbi:membrane-bound alpha-1,6- mannosyltransferase Initiation-specific [Phlyctochytrium planicorne]|nr:membrane-bound alpha-1,6- mannosyltransferase Initiation-specific [Phlyctochytrium planicorne]